ncbi:MAG: S8 family serine peptidase, partial [Candidatus Omnitrophica bacterium]|nr:S8 family serine peptidase [Candidatus Omnitrophota bacterium]
QTVATFSNGSVDIVAPGGDGDIITPEDNLYTVGADNRAWWAWGTSFATPHVSALLALQLQYARRTGSPEPIDFNEGKPFEVNNGYLWEVMKHSAQQLTSEPYDPVYQGKGKIWAAETDPLPPTPKDGSIDCMAEKWPLNPEVEYLNYLYREEGLYPAYYIGTSMYYDVNLTNNTNTAGNYASDIENINLTATQAYYQHEGEINTPGAPIEVFPAVSSLTAGSQEILSDTYYLPWALVPGLNRTILDLEFELTDDTNNRLIKVTYPYANIWCPPPLINEGFPIE